MQNASDVHTFTILENGKPAEAEFHFDRMTTKLEQIIAEKKKK